jgi:hypothetical protein
MDFMAETFGKRQRGEAKLKRREAKEERRAVRKAQRQDPAVDAPAEPEETQPKSDAGSGLV